MRRRRRWAYGFGDRLTALRVNGVGDAEHGADMLAARRAGPDFVILPKADDAAAVHDTLAVCERPVLAMIETPRGVLDALAIARVAAGLIAGTNDLSAELGLPPSAGRRGLVASLQQIVLAARACGIPAFDGVHNVLEDEAGLTAQAEEGRDFGFTGKSVIHPAQIATVNRVFSPGQGEVAAARALIAAATGGAERHEGRMIEAMHVEQAQRILARAMD